MQVIYNNVLIEQTEIDKTESGVNLPSSTKEDKTFLGVVVAVGEKVHKDIQLGDSVYAPNNDETFFVKVEGRKYIITNDKNILCLKK